MSRQTGESFQLVLERYAAERFLYRLGESEYRDDFVLKGATLFKLWGGGTYRPTRDMDFTGYGNPLKEHVSQALQEICAIPEEDGISFDTTGIRLESIREDAAYKSFRARFEARLAGAKISMQIDIGFGNAIYPASIDSRYPTMLDHPPPRIMVYPREAFVAEKLHAMVVLGNRNSRYKDFYDIYTITSHFAFQGRSLQQAVVRTFNLRSTAISQERPVVLTPQFYADANRAEKWRSYIRRNQLEGAPSDFELVGERLTAFLIDIWRSIAREIQFNAMWPKGGPWRHKPYDAYKSSGVEWLGEIPPHWEVKRTKSLLIKNESGVWGSDFDDEGIVVLRSTEQTIDGHWAISDPARRRLSVSEYQSSRLREGDLVVTKSSGSSKHIGKTSIVTKEIAGLNCCFSNFMQRLRVKEDVEPRFVWYAFNGDLGRKQLDYLSGTTSGLANINAEIIGMVNLALPPISEQMSITGYLDSETAKMDALVAKKERLIELLQEKRAALISRAVTKGLDPDVPMKDSGVEWLGAIPAHWETRQLKRLFHIRNGSTPKSSEATYWDGDVTWITPEDLGESNQKAILRSRRSITEAGLRSCGTTLVPAGSIVLSSRAPIGYVAIAGVDLCTNQGCRSLVHRQTLSETYYFYYLLTVGSELTSLGQGSTYMELSRHDLSALVVIRPDFHEQEAIAEFLDRETAKIDALVARVREAVERLKELRAALISAAVTGRIDVREADASFCHGAANHV